MGHLLSSAIKMSASSAPATVTVFYDHLYAGTCATRIWSVSKNSVVQASGGGNTGASGSFSAANGDVISITCTSGVSGAACSGATVEIQKNAATVSSQTVTGFVATATATFTIDTTSAGYNMYSGAVA
jgi:hypothetical protein